MSETAPQSNPLLDNFEANKLAYQKEVFEASLYGRAGKTDFSDEAKNRLEEGGDYARHLAMLEKRQEAQDKQFADGRPFVEAEIDNSRANPYNYDNLHAEALEMNAAIDTDINAERDAKAAAQEAWVASLMQNDPHVRQMQMIAEDIARIGGTVVTPENDAKLAESLKDKEDRLQELLVKFTEQSNYPKAGVDAITSRLIDMTEPAPAEADDDDSDEPGVDAAEPKADTTDAPEADAADKADVLPASLDVTPDAVDVDQPAPLDVTPDATDALPAPLDVTPDADASAADALPEPLAVTPDAPRKWRFDEILNHPGDWSRSRKEALKGKLDKFRGRPTREKAKIIGAGIAVTAISIAIYQLGKQGFDTTPMTEVGNKLASSAAGSDAAVLGDSMNMVRTAGEHAFSAAGDAISGIGEAITFSADALTVVKGEGWTRTLTEAGVEPNEISSLLKKLLTTTDPAIKEWVYTMKDGNPGISHSGQMPADVLQSIMKMRG